MNQPRKPDSGYPEKQPANPEQARKPHPQKKPNPEEGGMEREPSADHAGED